MLTIEEFQNEFPNEEACRKHLFKCRWPSGYSCMRCGSSLYYYVQTRELYECFECGLQTSVTAGTLMHGTKLPLQYWFLTMFLVSDGLPYSARKLATLLSLNYRSAHNLLKKIRLAMQKDNGSIGSPNSRFLIASLNKIDDDSSFPNGEIVISPNDVGVGNSQIDEANPNIVHSDQSVQSDQSIELVQSVQVRQGKQINQYIKVSAKVSEMAMRARRILLNKVRAFIRQKYRSVNKSYFQTYLDEYCFHNSRLRSPDRFKRLLEASIFVQSIPKFRL